MRPDPRWKRSKDCLQCGMEEMAVCILDRQRPAPELAKTVEKAKELDRWRKECAVSLRPRRCAMGLQLFDRPLKAHAAGTFNQDRVPGLKIGAEPIACSLGIG